MKTNPANQFTQKTVAIFLCLLLAITLSGTPALASNDQYGVYYGHARIFGKAVHYDKDRDLLIVYGSLMIPSPNGWKVVESKKFHLTHPAYHTLRQEMATSVDKTTAMVMEGKLNVWPGQKEEVLDVELIKYQENYQIDIPQWYGFGFTLQTEQSYVKDISSPVVFVDTIADLTKVLDVPQDKRMSNTEVNSMAQIIINPPLDKLEYARQIANQLNRGWHRKWHVVKDDKAANELRGGVNGWQFYHGLLGKGNYYTESASVTRKTIDNFMNVIKPGGITPRQSGAAIMCGYLDIQRDDDGSIQKITISGALYDEFAMTNLYEDLILSKSNIQPNNESWELKNWTTQQVQDMEGKLCWISGKRVIIYNDNGGIKDQYFSLDNYITRDGFNNTLDVVGEVIRKGGVGG